VKKAIVLGHVISSNGIEVNKAKIDFIANLPPPTHVKDVRSFLRHVGFYNRCIKDISKITKLLSSFLAKDALFHFFEECVEEFTKVKEALTTDPILHPPV